MSTTIVTVTRNAKCTCIPSIEEELLLKLNKYFNLLTTMSWTIKSKNAFES